MPNITSPLPFPAPDVPERAPISSEPLTAHETLAAAALVVRIDAARCALSALDVPFWVWWAANLYLVDVMASLREGSPFTVRLHMRYPPELPKGV